ncbi:MAG: hypothetical protein H0V51_14020 [Chloroflexi bacterium]|nr:hypothetical protein [Chloroflexota bacterium]
MTATALIAAADEPTATPSPECVADELFVKFRPGADPAVVSARYGGTIRSAISFIDVYVVAVPYGTVAQKVAEFGADAEVEYAEPVGVARIPESPPGESPPCGGS